MSLEKLGKVGFCLAILLTVLGNGPVDADVRAEQRVTISVDEIVDDDLYVFAETVLIEGTVKGDLVVFGKEVFINGSVEGDLIAAGQNVVINGTITDDVRIAGQVLTLNSGAKIGDDFIAAGFSFESTPGSQIDGEISYAGFQSKMGGDVNGDVRVAGANCELSGRIGGDFKVKAESTSPSPPAMWNSPTYPIVPGGLTIAETAEITGDLKYEAIREAEISPEATIAGSIEFEPIQQSAGGAIQSPTIVDRSVTAIKSFFAMLLVGLLVVFLFPGWTEKVVNNMQQRPLASFGWGLLTSVGVLVGALVLLVATVAVAVLLGYASLENLLPAWLVLGAFSIAGLVAGFLIYATWIAKVVFSVWAGNRVVNGAEWSSSRKVVSLVIGLLIFVLISAIPFVGGTISLIVSLLGIGAGSIWLFDRAARDPSGTKSIPIKQVA